MISKHMKWGRIEWVFVVLIIILPLIALALAFTWLTILNIARLF